MAKATKAKNKKSKSTADSSESASSAPSQQAPVSKKTKSLLPSVILREFARLESRLVALEKRVHAMNNKIE